MYLQNITLMKDRRTGAAVAVEHNREQNVTKVKVCREKSGAGVIMVFETLGQF
jgi:hypothetical protein